MTPIREKGGSRDLRETVMVICGMTSMGIIMIFMMLTPMRLLIDFDYDYHDDDQDMEFPGRPLTLASPVLAHRIGQELLLEWEKLKEDASLNKACEREYARTSRSRKKLT